MINNKKIDFWQKWLDLKTDDNDFTISEDEYKSYVLQGGSVAGNGILSKEDLQSKLDKAVKMRARLFHIIQQEEFMNEYILSQVLQSKKSIDKYAYIKHDKDFDFEKNEPKKSHFHIIVKMKTSTPVALLSVAKWFNVPVNLIKVLKGKYAFEQNVQYLTHESEKEQKKGKYKYDDSEVKSNFNFRDLIEEYKQNYNPLKTPEAKFEWRAKVFNGLDLSEVPEEIYLKDRVELNNLRREYVRTRAVIPFLRTNIFIEGMSGVGKTIIAREYANSLCGYTLTPENYDKNVFEVGGKGVLLQGYTGQKIIIWDDIRSINLVEGLGGMSGFLTTFDPIPSRSEQNIKYGSIRLVNTHNIITGKENFEEFIDNLLNFEVAKDEEADKQIRRRFPIIASINKINYDLKWNKQFFDPFEENYKTYYKMRGVGLNLESKKIKLLNNDLKGKHFLHMNNKVEDAEVIYKTAKEDDENIIDVNQLLLDFEEEKEIIECDESATRYKNKKEW